MEAVALNGERGGADQSRSPTLAAKSARISARVRVPLRTSAPLGAAATSAVSALN